MTHLSRMYFVAIVLVFCSAFTVPRAVRAQMYGSGQTLTCSSDDGRRHYCSANTSGGVQLTRQISGSACIQGQTWGYDQQGVWVDRGCRAQFFANGNGFGNGQGQTLTCSSDDGGRHYCSANTSGGVQLTRQISGSACIQGQTWGYDQQGVWVDRGCRAEFVANGYGYGNGQGQTLTCSSDDGKRHYCGGNGLFGSVQLTRQISGSPCIEGKTWGRDRRGIWVDRGCRAQFLVNAYSGGQGPGQTLTCSSDDGGLHYCSANTSGGVQLTRQISGTPCIQGKTWGYDSRGVWVDRGCRAQFQVR